MPGVGLYTASAVLSIAHGLPLPVVDGNVRRVLARLLALRGPQFLKDGPYYNRAEELLDHERPGDWNQALMELGATVCAAEEAGLPRVPAAPSLRGHGPSARRGAARGPAATGARGRDRGRRARRAGRARAARAPPRGRLLDRMWEVPQTSLESRGRADLARELEERHGLRVVPGPLAVRARHAVTFRRITLEGYTTRLRHPLPEDPERFLWARPEEVARLAVASSTRKLLKGLRAPQLPLEL